MRAHRTLAGKVGVAILALAGAATVAPVPPASAAPADHEVPASIDASGRSDVTAALLTFFRSVPDGSTISFPAGATYRVDGTLQLTGRRDLTFDGNGATIKAVTPGDRNRRHWWFIGGGGIAIHDLKVKGANPLAGLGDAAWAPWAEAQHGFEFKGVHGVTLERVTVNDVYGDFVYLGPGATGWTKDVRIVDSTFERNGRQGISITGAERVLIEGNRIGETRRATFDLEPNGAGWGARDVRIIGNVVGRGRLLFIAAHGYRGEIRDVVVERNVLRGRAMNSSVDAGGGVRSNITIAGNTADTQWGNPGGGLMYFKGATGVRVLGNVQPMQPRRGNAGVLARRSCDVVVEGNTFPNASEEVRLESPTCAS
jgi:hypothetical protein